MPHKTTAPRPVLQPEHLEQAYRELSTSKLRSGPWPTTLAEVLQHSLYGPLVRILARSLALQQLKQQRQAIRAALVPLTHDARGKAAANNDHDETR